MKISKFHKHDLNSEKPKKKTVEKAKNKEEQENSYFVLQIAIQ